MSDSNEQGANPGTSQVLPQIAQAPKRLSAAERQRKCRENKSAKKKAEEKEKMKNYAAKRKEGMTLEERREFLDKKNLSKRRNNEKMSLEKREEFRRNDRERKKNDVVRRSDRIRKQKAKEDMDVDQQAEYLERMRTVSETHRRVKRTQATMNDGLRNKEILEGTLCVQRLEDSADSIGKMDLKCKECGAFKFKREPPGFCCSNGKVKTAPFPEPPTQLSELWTSKGAQGNLLKKYSREINNAVALSSIKVVEKRFQSFTPSVIFQGQVKHFAGPLLPAQGEIPRFAQLYCVDAKLENTQRFENLYIPPNTSKADKEGLRNLLPKIERIIHAVNPFVKDFKMILEIPEDELADGKIVISAKEKPSTEHSRRYNLQANLQEVSILTNEEPHDLVLLRRGGGLHTIHDLNPKGMSLHFTLLFPHGTKGWDQDEKQVGGKRRITAKQFYVYHLQIRDNENQNFLMRAMRLFQEFCCMAWVTIENQRLNFQRFNQKALRADSYKSVREATEERIREAGPRADQLYNDDHQNPLLGRKILAASHMGSKRWFNVRHQDGMAILRKFGGKPDLFITMTCNPQWPEIKQELMDGQTAQDRPDIVARVFKLKKDQLMRDLINGQILGKVVGFLWTVEFQKRGLPHCHILLILSDKDRLITPDIVDSIISAELPPCPSEASTDAMKVARQTLENIVLQNMIHGPCGKENPTSQCMENGKCTKKFPKEFVRQTAIDPEKNYAIYRRRSPSDGGRSVKHNGKEVNNSHVVPYNGFLSLKYNCHINVESCCSSKSCKYICKYVNKGNDRAMAAKEVEGQPRDEIAEYEDMRSVGSVEACWHIFGFEIHDRFPAVMALRVHLPEQQQIIFDEENELEALENQRETELTAFFDFNRESIEKGIQPEDLPLYVQMPEEQRYEQKLKKWIKRKQKGSNVIGRVHSLNPVVGEAYHLRMLLHDNHCRGKISFDDLMKLPGGKVCETFKEVCNELGLLNDDSEWNRILDESAATKMCPEIRALFVIILLFCLPSNPLTLFNNFWDTWCDDIQYKSNRRGVHLDDCQLKTLVLLDLEMRLSSFEKGLSDFGLPTPTIEEMTEIEHVTSTQAAVIREELDFHFEDLKNTVDESVQTFTPEQLTVYEKVMDAIKNERSLCVFLSARGGCGKTYLLNGLLAAVRTLEPGGCVALAMATTGIAANLLQLGRTFHSRMKAPLDPDKDSTLKISAQSKLADLMRLSKLFLIDEATMLNKFHLEAMDRSLRDLLQKPDVPFGGKVVILAGDFKQCLPVIPGQQRSGIVKQAVNKSYLWSFFQVLELSVNMRVHASGDPHLEEFDKWTLDIGNGVKSSIKAPANMVATRIIPNSKDNSASEGDAMAQFSEKIFPNLAENIGDKSWIDGRAILAPTNKEVQMLNDILIEKLPGSSEVIRSADQIENTDGQISFNVEYLNTLTPSGFPPHSLILRPGMPLMLLRNLNPREGLCNGTKLVFEGTIDGKVLKCKVSGSGKTVLIPRITLIPKLGDLGMHYPWSRRQFPVKPAFAMTINKSQGKLFDQNLNNSYFLLRSNTEECWDLAAL